VISFVIMLGGLAVAATGQHRWSATLLVGAGLIGAAVTIAKNVNYALRSDVDSLPGRRLWYRAMVAYLHFIQPLARLCRPRGERAKSRGQTMRGERSDHRRQSLFDRERQHVAEIAQGLEEFGIAVTVDRRARSVGHGRKPRQQRGREPDANIRVLRRSERCVFPCTVRGDPQHEAGKRPR